jgi:hypothetical protein
MVSGSLKVKLRPLRLAFLVDPAEKGAVIRAIETTSFLWGGAFNPILPLFQRLPRSLKRAVGSRINASTLLDGYLDAFDPDFVITVGALESIDGPFRGYEVVKCSTILESVGDDGMPAFGIGLFELLRGFAENELKFVRQIPLRMRFPKFQKHRLFFGSLFGLLSENVLTLFKRQFDRLPGLKWQDCTMDNYLSFLASDNLFVRRLGALHIRPIRYSHRGADCIFLLDADQPLDVLDYWNLRALGWNILPVAKQAATKSETIRSAAAFIDDNAFAFRANPSLYNHTIIIPSRTTKIVDVEQFGRLLKPLLRPPQHKHDWKITYQFWFPRIWDEWAHESDGTDLCELEVLEAEYDLQKSGDQIAFKSLMPESASPFGSYRGPRCANDVELRIWSSEFLPAEVIPKGDRRIARAAAALDFTEWRCSKQGLVHLPKHKNWTEHLSVVAGEHVFAAWMETQGWNVQLSDKGKVARQMLKQLGGKRGMWLLAKEGVVELLAKFAQGRTMHESAFRGAVAEISNRQEFKMPTADRILEWLVESRTVQPGLEMQCPKCSQHSWYSVTEADYELRCSKCLEMFSLPAHDLSSISWSYRTIGPFSLPQHAYGVYAVLLTLHFFTREFASTTTPMLSFSLMKGNASIEADLGLFYRESKYGETGTDSVFAECKTYNKFQKADGERMLLIADHFPGAILVFATLRKSIEESERKILRRVANRGRRFWKADHRVNSVIVLTGNELLTDKSARATWEKLGGVHAAHSRSWGDRRELVALSDDTQQIYLGMEPWHQRFHEQRTSRLQKNAEAKRLEGTQSGKRKKIALSFPYALRKASY